MRCCCVLQLRSVSEMHSRCIQADAVEIHPTGLCVCVCRVRIACRWQHSQSDPNSARTPPCANNVCTACTTLQAITLAFALRNPVSEYPLAAPRHPNIGVNKRPMYTHTHIAAFVRTQHFGWHTRTHTHTVLHGCRDSRDAHQSCTSCWLWPTLWSSLSSFTATTTMRKSTVCCVSHRIEPTAIIT